MAHQSMPGRSVRVRVFVTVVAAVLAVVFLGAAEPARAAPITVYSTFGAGDSFDAFAGWDILGGGVDPFLTSEFHAAGFTPSQGGPLTDIYLAVEYVQGTNLVDLALTDTVGGVPGNILETWQFAAMLDPFNDPLIHLAGNGSTILSSAQQYWLVAKPGAADTWASWLWSDPAVTGPWGIQDNLEPWLILDETQGALRVMTPEPATLGLLAIGLAGAVWGRRRRH